MPRAKAKKRHDWRSRARASPDVRRAAVALGKRIRFLRLARHLTLEQMEPLARLDWRHIGVIEAGKTNTTVASLVGIAKALGVRLRDLFEDV